MATKKEKERQLAMANCLDEALALLHEVKIYRGQFYKQKVYELDAKIQKLKKQL